MSLVATSMVSAPTVADGDSSPPRQPTEASSSIVATVTPHPVDWDAPVSFGDPLPDPPPPTSFASPGLIASWVLEREINEERGFTDTDVGEMCAELGVDALPVIEKLNAYRRGSEWYSTDDIFADVDADALARLKGAGRAALCPVPMWCVGATSGRERYYMKDCDSWTCPDHGPEKARHLLALASFRFTKRRWDIFYAEADDDPSVTTRLRARRRPERAGGGLLTVKRDDGRLHLFSTTDLSGREEPTNWARLCSQEALERLAASVRLPGVKRTRWSDHGWRPRLEVVRGGSGPTEEWLALPGVSRALHDRVRELAVEEAHRRYGVTPGEDGVPVDRLAPQVWAALVNEKMREALAAG